MSAKIDIAAIPRNSGSRYPKQFHQAGGNIPARVWQAVGIGLTHFGVNRVTLVPGAASSLRHWHTHEDEFVVILEGEAVLITDAGEQVMRPGDMAAFPAGAKNGHHLVNRSKSSAVFLAIGNNSADDRCYYSDVDLVARSYNEGWGYITRDGRPYET